MTYEFSGMGLGALGTARDDAQAAFMRGQQLFDSGNFQQALAAFTEANRLQPNDPHAYATLIAMAMSLVRLNRCQEAIPLFVQANNQGGTLTAEHIAAMDRCRTQTAGMSTTPTTTSTTTSTTTPTTTAGKTYTASTGPITRANIEDLQRAVGVSVDGIWGPQTSSAVTRAGGAAALRSRFPFIDQLMAWQRFDPGTGVATMAAATTSSKSQTGTPSGVSFQAQAPGAAGSMFDPLKRAVESVASSVQAVFVPSPQGAPGSEFDRSKTGLVAPGGGTPAPQTTDDQGVGAAPYIIGGVLSIAAIGVVAYLVLRPGKEKE